MTINQEHKVCVQLLLGWFGVEQRAKQSCLLLAITIYLHFPDMAVRKAFSVMQVGMITVGADLTSSIYGLLKIEEVLEQTVYSGSKYEGVSGENKGGGGGGGGLQGIPDSVELTSVYGTTRSEHILVMRQTIQLVT